MKSSAIAILLTCHNRKSKTILCLESLYRQQDFDQYKTDIFLVDDGSADGTAEAVQSLFPEVHLLAGDGNLYWAGGMRLAWKTALSTGSYDYYLWVNDDTHFYENTLCELMKADAYSLQEYGRQGVYAGSTKDPVTGQHSYGGRILSKMNHPESKRVIPDGTYQPFHVCNGNILMVTAPVVAKIGILNDRYIHGIADFDYSMRAFQAGFPLLVLPYYCGECVNDHGQSQGEEGFSLKKRIQYLYSPKGLSYSEYMYFIRLFFPKYQYISLIKLWIRTLFPAIRKAYKSQR